MKRWMQNLFMIKIRQAVDEYCMIEDGDRILVGVSGGKDSSLLFYALTKLSKMKVYNFEVVGLTVDHGLIGNLEPYKLYCDENGLNLNVHTEHYAKTLSHGQEYAPCYTCSRLRKGILKRYAIENGFNKIAIGHTKDDLVETFMMNILQHGKIATMAPVSRDPSGIQLIRPMMYVDEPSIIKSIQVLQMPLMHDVCTFSHERLRRHAEDIINQIELTSPDFSDKVIQALKNVDENKLL